MAHFAELDENNIVLRVIVVDDKDCLDENNQESEEVGVAFCQLLLGGRWIQTSYNRRIRKNYAAIGGYYDEENDVFIYAKPYESWILNNETFQWEPPIPKPDNDGEWFWDQEKGMWIQ